MRGEIIVVVLGIAFLVWIFSLEIKRSPLRGIFLILLTAGGAVLPVLGKSLGFNGNIAAVIYLIIMISMAYCYQYIIHKDSKLKDKDKFWF